MWSFFFLRENCDLFREIKKQALCLLPVIYQCGVQHQFDFLVGGFPIVEFAKIMKPKDCGFAHVEFDPVDAHACVNVFFPEILLQLPDSTNPCQSLPFWSVEVHGSGFCQASPTKPHEHIDFLCDGHRVYISSLMCLV